MPWNKAEELKKILNGLLFSNEVWHDRKCNVRDLCTVWCLSLLAFWQTSSPPFPSFLIYIPLYTLDSWMLNLFFSDSEGSFCLWPVIGQRVGIPFAWIQDKPLCSNFAVITDYLAFISLQCTTSVRPAFIRTWIDTHTFSCREVC